MSDTTSMPDPLESWSPGAMAALRRVAGVGPALAARIRAAFPSPTDLLAAPVERLVVRCPGLNHARAAAVRSELLRWGDEAVEAAYRSALRRGVVPNDPGPPDAA